MHLKINLASRSYLNRRQFNVAVAVCALILGCLLLINIRNVASNAGEISSVARQIGQYEGKLGGAVPEKEYQAVLTKIKFANDIIDKKTFNWLTLLDKLETVMPDAVALTTIEPNPKTEELKLTGAAKSFKNVRQFVENLESSKDFRDVYLVSHAELKVGKNQQGINFNISCKVSLK